MFVKRTDMQCDAARPTDAPTSTPTSPPSGPMTRARAKLLQAKVNSLFSSYQFDTSLDGVLLHTTTLCIIRYKPPPRRPTSPEAAPELKLPESECPPESSRSVRRNRSVRRDSAGVSGLPEPGPGVDIQKVKSDTPRTPPGVSGHPGLSGRADPDCPARVMGLRA